MNAARASALGATLCAAVHATLGTAAEAGVPPASALSRMSLEELAQIEVSSVSKRPERLADAAAAIYVITRDDIRRAGVTSLPEALRLAPGVQVARTSSHSYAITVRGFNGSNANKLLVMIDGRSVYTPLHSGVFWDMQDVMLEDVERIEVVRGPGGTLWGANAVNGVINILTRSAKDTRGALVGAHAGTHGRGAVARYGFGLGEHGSLRVYAKARNIDPTASAAGADVADAWRMRQVGFRGDWLLGSDTFTLQGDAHDSWAQVPRSPDRDVRSANLLARWQRDLHDGAGAQLQFYCDHMRRSQPGSFTLEQDTCDVEAQHSFTWGAGHDIVWGGGLRHQRDRTAGSAQLFFDPANKRLNLASVFVQDALALSPQLKLTLGAKVERNSYTGVELQPNVRLAWKPDERHLAWAAISRAVRTPSRLDRELTILSPAGNLLGGPNFVSERVIAYEAGYRSQPTPRLSYSLAAFVNDYDKLRSIEPAGGANFVLGNGIRARTHGIEGWGFYQMGERWRLSMGFNRLSTRFRFAPGASGFGSPNAGVNDPKYQVLLRSSLNLPRDVEFDVGLRAVGSLPNPAVPAYVALDARLAWSPRPGLELSIVGFDLLDGRHPEFGSAATRSEIERSVSARISWAF